MLSAIRAASERRRRPSVAPRVSSTGRDGKKLEGLALILVVEDDADARETFAAYLTKAGYRVEQAANGQEALDAITRSKPALVVMDLSMPVLDGWEATRRIKSDAATSDVFVIAVTGHSTDQGLRRATDLGADAVLTKPCQPGTILAGIWALLGPSS